MNDRATLTVLFSVRRPDHRTNPFLTELASALEVQGIAVRWFAWRHALLGRWGVLHLHWPENLYRGRTASRRIVKAIATVLLIARIRLHRTPVVWTVHNQHPHEEGSRLDARLDRMLRATVATRVVMYGGDEGDILIKHGHYADSYPSPITERTPGMLLMFGKLRKYKGADALLRTFVQLTDPTLSLVVAGSVSDDAIAAWLRERTAEDPRITLRLEHVPPVELSGLIGQAELVVLPYRTLGNSGALLLALSLGTPVLAPRTTSTIEIADEIGPGWLTLFDAPLTPAAIVAALETARRPRASSRPVFTGRDWSTIAASYARLYRQLRQ